MFGRFSNATVAMLVASLVGTGCGDPNDYGIELFGYDAIAVGASPAFYVEDDCAESLDCVSIAIGSVEKVSSDDEDVAKPGKAEKVPEEDVFTFPVEAKAEGSTTITVEAKISGADDTSEAKQEVLVAEPARASFSAACVGASGTNLMAEGAPVIYEVALESADGVALAGEGLDVSSRVSASEDGRVSVSNATVAGQAAFEAVFSGLGTVDLSMDIAPAPVTADVYSEGSLSLTTLVGDSFGDDTYRPIIVELLVDGTDPCSTPGPLRAVSETPSVCTLESTDADGDKYEGDELDLEWNGADFSVKAVVEDTGTCIVEIYLDEADLSEVVSFDLVAP